MYGEPVTNIDNNNVLNQHLGIVPDTIDEEVPTEHRNHVSYIDILRAMEKGNNINKKYNNKHKSINASNKADNKSNNYSSIKMKRAMSMHPSLMSIHYPHQSTNTTPLKKLSSSAFKSTKRSTKESPMAQNHNNKRKNRQIKSSPLLRKATTASLSNLTTKSTSMLKSASNLYNIMTNNQAYQHVISNSAVAKAKDQERSSSSTFIEEFLIAMNEFKKVLNSQRSVYGNTNIQKPAELFEIIAGNDRACLDIQAFLNCMNRLDFGFGLDQATSIFNYLDVDNSGLVDKDDF
eukprot:g8691.t1